MTVRPRTFATRNHPAWWAFALHRISGLVLVLFLPVHLFVLSRALHDAAGLDRFLTWADTPWVKLAETGLVILFAAHVTGGLRLLAIEFLPWQDHQKSFIAIATGLALLTGLMFLLSAFGGGM
jgi:fumarate reductase subunit D